MRTRLLALLLILATPAVADGPPVWTKSGTVDTSSDAVPIGATGTEFTPASICVANTGATNNLCFNLKAGTAAVCTDDSQNFLVAPGQNPCIALENKNLTGPVTVNLIAAASTTTYAIRAVGISR